MTEQDVRSGNLDEVRKLLDQADAAATGTAQTLLKSLGPQLEQAWSGFASRVVQMTMGEVVRNLEFEAARY